LFEIAGAEEDVSRRALALAAYKLPIKCKVVSKEELEAILAEAEAPAQAGS
jgi:large subunit ribosomal protein L16